MAEQLTLIIAVPVGSPAPQRLAEVEAASILMREDLRWVSTPTYGGFVRHDDRDWHRWTVTAHAAGDVIR
jgi:hypothetical protein